MILLPTGRLQALPYIDYERRKIHPVPLAPLALVSAEAKSGAAVFAIAFALLGAEENHPPCRAPSQVAVAASPQAGEFAGKTIGGRRHSVRSLDVANEAHRD